MNKIVYITLMLCMIPTFFAHAYTFNRNLSVGDTGEDVLELQKFLNSDPRTQIAQSGVGSPGNETTYFGPKTKEAVIKLQNLHAQEILSPHNLTQGTGFVGKTTLAFIHKNQFADIQKEIKENLEEKPLVNKNLNKSIKDIATSTSPTDEDMQRYLSEYLNGYTTKTKNNTQENIEIPKFLVSKKTIRPKEILYVGSQIDLTTVDFYLDNNKMDPSCKHSKYNCAFRVNLDPGTYTLKTSNKALGSYTIKVLGKTEPIPEVSLKSLSLSKENIIKGRNFTKNITIYTLYGVFTSETSNNSFILEFPKRYVENAKLTEGLFYIENENGLTSDMINIQYEK